MKNSVRMHAGHALSQQHSLLVRHNELPLRVAVPLGSLAPVLWSLAQALRDDFEYELIHPVSRLSDDQGGRGGEAAGEAHGGQGQAKSSLGGLRSDEIRSEADLACAFLHFIARRWQDRVANDDHNGEDATASLADLIAQLLRIALQHFHQTYLVAPKLSIHALAARSDNSTQILRSYYESLETSRQAMPNAPILPEPPKSALFQAAADGQVGLVAMFGGQGTNLVYFDELQAMFDAYRCFLQPFIAQMSSVLNLLVARARQDGLISAHRSYGLDPISWLLGTTPRPPAEYLATVPVAAVLIGLTQLSQYLVTCRVVGVEPGALRGLFRSAIGHSQGVVTAVAISASSDAASYTSNSIKTLRLLFYLSLRAHETSPPPSVPSNVVEDCVEGGEGRPSPMLFVGGLKRKQLQKHVDIVNRHFAVSTQLHISLVNGITGLVVTGSAVVNYSLVKVLRAVRWTKDTDESRVPFSKRKYHNITMRFLPITVPFHNPHLYECVDKVIHWDLEEDDLWQPSDLGIPVYDNADGSDLRNAKVEEGGLARLLATQVLTTPVDWLACTKTAFSDKGVSHALDFGAGISSGIGAVTARNLEGTAVRVVIVGEKLNATPLGPWVYHPSQVRRQVDWKTAFGPEIVGPEIIGDSATGKPTISTRFSKLLHKPPVMVAGMTPTTVSARLVAAVLNAGYHIELAGGGHYTRHQLRRKVDKICSLIRPGLALTLNSLYLSPRHFGPQLEEWLAMKREGYPLEGFTVAGGVPAPAKAAEIIDSLEAAGLKHVGFKPGTLSALRQVVEIAKSRPRFPIILQWTGGRAGGHHSYEDMHDPLIRAYGSIRSCPNIHLVVGGGFGRAEEAIPWFTGDWSTSYEMPPMPIDGVLLASRMMVALEAETSDSVKDLIVAASGCTDTEWEETYSRPVGGIITVTSEFGEPIHKLATRAVLFWRELDERLFSLPRGKPRADWLERHKQYVIQKLNADHQKVWFPKIQNGGACGDLLDMTYGDLAYRFVELSFRESDSRWIDGSWRRFMAVILHRIEERFRRLEHQEAGEEYTSVLSSLDQLDRPFEFLDTFFGENFPRSKDEMLLVEDRAWFLQLCRNRGYKPVPFVPVLDENFEMYFKKDSLWQSENIESVPGQDPQRVCILHGPVAAAFSTTANETSKSILDGMTGGLTAGVGRLINVDPAVLAAPVPTSPDAALAKWEPLTQDWVKALRKERGSAWFCDLITSPTIVQGRHHAPNSIARLFVPRPGQTVRLERSDGPAVRVQLFGRLRPEAESTLVVDIAYSNESKKISTLLYETVRGKPLALPLFYIHRPEEPWAPIFEEMGGRDERIRDFYWQLWCMGSPDEEEDEALRVREEAQVDTYVTHEALYHAWDIMGGSAIAQDLFEEGSVRVGFGYGIVLGWKAIARTLLSYDGDGDLLNLVHLANKTKTFPGAKPIRVGDKVTSRAWLGAVMIVPAGKTVTVECKVSCGAEEVMQVTSTFLFRGKFRDHGTCFERVVGTKYKVHPATVEQEAVLRAKKWIQWADSSERHLSDRVPLFFEVDRYRTFDEGGSEAFLRYTGEVSRISSTGQRHKVGSILYESTAPNGKDPVAVYLDKHGNLVGTDGELIKGPYALNTSPVRFTMPASNEPYAGCSGDINPIHLNPYFAAFVGLNGLLTHGMLTNAVAADVVRKVATGNSTEDISSFQCDFLDMVFPSQELSFEVKHVGMRSGSKVITVEGVNKEGSPVIRGSATVCATRTAYVFTGQGSQSKGMGQEQYKTSPAARAVWDAADQHCVQRYGFSLHDVVRNNPKEKTIYFRGMKGDALRRRYLRMTCEVYDEESGRSHKVRLFPDITNRTTELSFSSPEGLLFLTQFAQLALVTFACASWEDMMERQLVHPDLMFSGHSLGEFAALACVARVVPLSALLDIVYYRGLLMQRGLVRDERRRSPFGMCAVNPSRVAPGFREQHLAEVVKHISEISGQLCQLVNFNVEDQQYVAAGHITALQAMGDALDELSKYDAKDNSLYQGICQAAWDSIVEATKDEGWIAPTNGKATIHLAGIEMPFHSRHMLPGVEPFRNFLSKHLPADQFKLGQLEGRYLPSVTGEVFAVSKEYVTLGYDLTGSPKLAEILRHWDHLPESSPNWKEVTGREIFLELLAYQIASPVRWVTIQDQLLRKYDCQTFIEVGTSPILCNMARRTVKAKFEESDNCRGQSRRFLCRSTDEAIIYHSAPDSMDGGADVAAGKGSGQATVDAKVSATPPQETLAPPAATMAPAIQQTALAPVASIADESLSAIHHLRVLVAIKLKKDVGEIAADTTIKALANGKSTLQNEIVGDLEAEFGSLPERAEEQNLSEVAAALSTAGTPGKFSSSQLGRLVSRKMPAKLSLTAIKDRLSSRFGFGPMRTNAALLFMLSYEPPARIDSEEAALAWLTQVAEAYARETGFILAQASDATATGSGQVATVNSADFEEMKRKHHEMSAKQIDLLADYLGRDVSKAAKETALRDETISDLTSKIDAVAEEHGENYTQAIASVFVPAKARVFDSYWNWARQDLCLLTSSGSSGIKGKDRQHMLLMLRNRLHPTLKEDIEHILSTRTDLEPSLVDAFERVRSHSITAAPLYFPQVDNTKPHIDITDQGDIVYSEKRRRKDESAIAYLRELNPPLRRQVKTNNNRATAKMNNVLQPLPSPGLRRRLNSNSSLQWMTKLVSGASSKRVHFAPDAKGAPPEQKPQLQLKWADPHHHHDGGAAKLTKLFFRGMAEIALSGISLQHQNILVTGAGQNSIGSELLKSLLGAGAQVIVTTSSYSPKSVSYYEGLFKQYGSKGSRLVIAPFNQASKRDVQALVDWIYSAEGLALDLDCVIPFAAIPENGREIEGIDDKSEVAHRAMLTNVVRLLGAVLSCKARLGSTTRPAQVLLPLSPNHGVFGGDGLYAESKLGLEALLSKWQSEGWKDYLSLVGVVIGWTRGTGLMSATNITAAGFENMQDGVRTFSCKEMAFNLLGLFHPAVVDMTKREPVWADFGGNMDTIANLGPRLKSLRQSINDQAARKRAIWLDEADLSNDGKELSQAATFDRRLRARSYFNHHFPRLPAYGSIAHDLQGVVDLQKTVVVVGYSEIGPWGSARTRWEMESLGDFSMEGYIELAFLMGHIRFCHDRLADGADYVGWVERESGKPIADADVGKRFGEAIKEHCGIRKLEPGLLRGYDPAKKEMFHQVALCGKMERVEVTAEDAALVLAKYGDKVDIFEEGGTKFVQLREGAEVLVSKAGPWSRFVGGLIPTGWDARRLGVPEANVESMDRCGVWALTATADAFASAGIQDPYELYKYVHPTEVGNAIGSAMGGLMSMEKMYRDRRLGMPVQNDILQETFINTVGAWVQLLLLSCSGPVITPTAACATAAVSIAVARSAILNDQAKIMVCGGYDDLTEESSAEFANMAATLDNEADMARGRPPSQACRPMSSTRAGFTESQGGGTQILARADVAIAMGLPIYGIVAMAASAHDKQGFSIPAPGHGILSTARETHGDSSALDRLSLEDRKRELDFGRSQIKQWLTWRLDELRGAGDVDDEWQDRVSSIFKEARRKEQLLLSTHGMLDRLDPVHISPLRHSLAVFGLGVDDIAFLSFHGTSTSANDTSESNVHNTALKHLGRSPGNAALVIAQKYLTGHAKGAACAFMINGALQAMQSGIIPGNRNLDNVDEKLQQFEHLVYPSQSIRLRSQPKACLLTSFGFGQAGAELCLVYPGALFSAMDEMRYEGYVTANARRAHASTTALQRMLLHGDLVKIKKSPPFELAMEHAVLLDPTARAKKIGHGPSATWLIRPSSASAESKGKPKRAERSCVLADGAVVLRIALPEESTEKGEEMETAHLKEAVALALAGAQASSSVVVAAAAEVMLPAGAACDGRLLSVSTRNGAAELARKRGWSEICVVGHRRRRSLVVAALPLSGSVSG